MSIKPNEKYFTLEKRCDYGLNFILWHLSLTKQKTWIGLEFVSFGNPTESKLNKQKNKLINKLNKEQLEKNTIKNINEEINK